MLEYGNRDFPSGWEAFWWTTQHYKVTYAVRNSGKKRNTILCTHFVAHTKALHIHTHRWSVNTCRAYTSSPTCTLGREPSIGALVELGQETGWFHVTNCVFYSGVVCFVIDETPTRNPTELRSVNCTWISNILQLLASLQLNPTEDQLPAEHCKCKEHCDCTESVRQYETHLEQQLECTNKTSL